MPGLDAILGQERAVGQLRRALARGALHHAYLFDGHDGVGKRTTARALAQACNCTVRPGEGCGDCDSCRKIETDVHPDVKWFPVAPEKGLTERVRELLPSLAFPPHEALHRFVILDPADELNVPASNVLLKTLEEPPPRTHFVLITALAASLLVTIRSRCQRVTFAPLDDGLVLDLLLRREGLDEERARRAAAVAEGSIGKALALAQSDDFPRRAAAVRQMLEAALAGQVGAVLAAAELSTDREDAGALLDLLWLAVRDGLLVAAGLEERVAPGRLGEARRLAAARGEPELLRAVRAIGRARAAIDGFVSPQLTFEELLFSLARRSQA